MVRMRRRGLTAFSAALQPGEKASNTGVHCGFSRMGRTFSDVLHDFVLERAGRRHVKCLCQPNHKFFVGHRFIGESFGLLLFERQRWFRV